MHHLIFEGAELSGKSWIMSQIYNILEPKYNQSGVILDGCHWFNCDVGVFGTEHGQPVIGRYVKIFDELKGKNILAEKFHLSDIVYNRMHFNREVEYKTIEDMLLDLEFKIVLLSFPEDKKLIEKRIQDRLNIYPHYTRIVREPLWYIEQQREYIKEAKKSCLPVLVVETERLPDERKVREILQWIKEE
jgi:hypothetical protein